MPYEAAGDTRRRIAVIGAGISGLSAAYALSETCRVTVFESGAKTGGHARTVLAGRRGDQPVDTGFIVFNHANYPRLSRLFDELGVPTAPSDMSFSASIRGGQFEYALRTLNSLVAQRRNLLRPKFYAMISDLLRFNARAEDLADDPAMTIRDLLGELGTGDWFRDHYLLPFSGAIWSTPTRDILDFPAAALVRFFRNHALLGLRGQHKWHTVRGGSVEYVRRLEAVLAERGVTVRTNTPIVSVRRMPVGVEVRADREGPDVFDEIVLATHADVSLKLLSDPSEAETRALSGIRFQDNHAILHADPSVMPQRQACWSSWNYAGQGGERDPIGITYWMNSLQPIPKDDPLFVTLNATREIRDDLIYDATTFRHPMYDRAIFDAQARLREMNGKRHTWFCGAWMKYGFHEDGCASGLEAAEAIVAQESLQVAA